MASAILQWRHNERHAVSNNQCLDCLLRRLFRRKSQKTSKLSVTGLCEGIHPWLVNSPHKGPVTRKMFPFDDVILICGVTVYRMNCAQEKCLYIWLFTISFKVILLALGQSYDCPNASEVTLGDVWHFAINDYSWNQSQRLALISNGK